MYEVLIWRETRLVWYEVSLVSGNRKKKSMLIRFCEQLSTQGCLEMLKKLVSELKWNQISA